MAFGYRTLDGVEAINELHRLEEVDGHLGKRVLDRRYRSP
jgi:hypothetical protein